MTSDECEIEKENLRLNVIAEQTKPNVLKDNEVNIEMFSDSIQPAAVICNRAVVADQSLPTPMQVDFSLTSDSFASTHSASMVPIAKELSETAKPLQENTEIGKPANVFVDKSQFLQICDDMINS